MNRRLSKGQTEPSAGLSYPEPDPATADMRTIRAAVAAARPLLLSGLARYGRAGDFEHIQANLESIVWERTAVSGRADWTELTRYTIGTARQLVKAHVYDLANAGEYPLPHEIEDATCTDFLDEESEREEMVAIARYVRDAVGDATWERAIDHVVNPSESACLPRTTVWRMRQVAHVARAAYRLAAAEPWLTAVEVQTRCVTLAPPRNVAVSTVKRAEDQILALGLIAWRVFRTERGSLW